MLELFTEQPADLVLAVQSVPDVSRYGSVILESDNRISGFVEKGQGDGPGLINAGIYLLRKAILEKLPEGVPVSLEKEVFPRLLGRRRVYGLLTRGTFIDIGVPEDLERARIVLAGKKDS